MFIRKAILMFLLGVSSASSMAEWTDMGGSDSKDTYIDLASISKQGDKVKMISLSNYNEARVIDGINNWSFKSLYEYDCKERKVRTLASVFFSEKMGKGKQTGHSGKVGEWKVIKANTMGEATWEEACKNR